MTKRDIYSYAGMILRVNLKVNFLRIPIPGQMSRALGRKPMEQFDQFDLDNENHLEIMGPKEVAVYLHKSES